MATALKLYKLLKALDVQELEAAREDKLKELAIVEEALAFRRKIAELTQSTGDGRPRAAKAAGTTADRAHVWLLEHGPAAAADLAQAIGVTRACAYQAMKKWPDRFTKTSKGWRAKK